MSRLNISYLDFIFTFSGLRRHHRHGRHRRHSQRRRHERWRLELHRLHGFGEPRRKGRGDAGRAAGCWLRRYLWGRFRRRPHPDLMHDTAMCYVAPQKMSWTCLAAKPAKALTTRTSYDCPTQSNT